MSNIRGAFIMPSITGRTDEKGKLYSFILGKVLLKLVLFCHSYLEVHDCIPSEHQSYGRPFIQKLSIIPSIPTKGHIQPYRFCMMNSVLVCIHLKWCLSHGTVPYRGICIYLIFSYDS